MSMSSLTDPTKDENNNETQSEHPNVVQTSTLNKKPSQTYAERMNNISRVKKSRSDKKDTSCKRRFCYGYIGDACEDDVLIDVKPRGSTLTPVPVALLKSRGKHKRSKNI